MSARPITLRIRRATGWQKFQVEVEPSAYLLDALEEAGRQDPSLLFRHACHHASCGSCGLRVNGRERLACLARLEDLPQNRPILLEPLRNFPLIGDLLVDFGPFMQSLDRLNLPLLRPLPDQGTPRFDQLQPQGAPLSLLPAREGRFESCIECGLCLSACPVVGQDPAYLGPAGLAAAGRLATEALGDSDYAARWRRVKDLVDGEHGLWRCHAAFECSEVCPAGVDPAGEILRLRGKLLRGGTA